MRTAIQFLSGGAAQLWQRIPFVLKAPLVITLGILSTAEVVREVNTALFSNDLAKGQAAQAAAQASNIDATRAAVASNKPVTGAERQIAATVFGLEADAEQKQAVAAAAVESEDDLLAKAKRGAKLTSTEKLKLRELQLREREVALREQEIGVKAAENKLKTAEATNADQKAAVQKMVNNMLLQMQLDKSGGDIVGAAMKQSAKRTPGMEHVFGN